MYTLFRSNSLHPVGISAARIKKWLIYPGLTLKNLVLQGGSGLYADKALHCHDIFQGQLYGGLEVSQPRPFLLEILYVPN